MEEFNSDLVVSQWTPLGFKLRDPDSRDDISKERFEGTVLRAIGRTMRKTKKEVPEDTGGAEAAPLLLLKVQKNPNESWPWFSPWWSSKWFFSLQAKIKEEKLDNEHEEGDQKVAIKQEEEEKEVSTGAAVEREMGRLVMTVAGEQKLLTFGPNDLLSTATMLDGDKVSGKSGFSCWWWWLCQVLGLQSFLQFLF